jgi:two-component system cell cycle response regulator DivK
MVMSGSASRNKAEISKPLNHQKTVNRKRILIVEDSQLNLRLLVDLLTARHYEILKTSEGLEAINFARDGQPDLILMDVRLPDICGLDVTRLLKHDERTKTIPIIAVTAFAMPDDQKKGLECGCDASPDDYGKASPGGANDYAGPTAGLFAARSTAAFFNFGVTRRAST